MTGNGNQANPMKIAKKNFVKTHQLTLFLVGYSYLEPLWASFPSVCQKTCHFLELSNIPTAFL